MLTFYLLTVIGLAGQAVRALPADNLVPATRDQITDREIQELSVVNDIKLSEALRCGIFFAGELGGLPFEKMFVFNSSFPAPECPEKHVPRWSTFCSSLWEKVVTKLVYENTSLLKDSAAKGNSIGDDICSLLLNKYKVPFVGKKSKRFPDGITIGMYSNGCGNKEWVDTRERHPEPVCCNRGKYYKCE